MLSWFVRKVKESHQEYPFLLLIAILIGFTFSRWFVWQTNGLFFVVLDNLEIHHYIIGLVLMTLGFLIITFIDEYYKKFGILFFGWGLGIFIDELGYLLTLGNYWHPLSYYVILIFSATIIFFICFRSVSKFISDRLIIPFFDFWDNLWQRYLKGKNIVK